jgi:hypothetical protein
MCPRVLRSGTHHGKHAACGIVRTCIINGQAGCACVNEVHMAVLENNGALSVVPKRRD